MNVKELDLYVKEALSRAFEKGNDGLLIEGFFSESNLPLSVSFAVDGELCTMSDNGSAIANLKKRAGDIWQNYAYAVAEDKGIAFQIEGDCITGQFSYIDAFGLRFRFATWLQYLLQTAYADLIFSNIPPIYDYRPEDRLLPLAKNMSDPAVKAIVENSYIKEQYGKAVVRPDLKYLNNEGYAVYTVTEVKGRYKLQDTVKGNDDGSVLGAYLDWNDFIAPWQKRILKAFGLTVEGESTVLYFDSPRDIAEAISRYIRATSLIASSEEYAEYL